jgi:hypothetical protein
VIEFEELMLVAKNSYADRERLENMRDRQQELIALGAKLEGSSTFLSRPVENPWESYE